jgi:hypothetical protein
MTKKPTGKLIAATRRDCFVATLLAMAKRAFPCRCKRFGESRSNLKRYSGTFPTVPLSLVFPLNKQALEFLFSATFSFVKPL